MPDYSPLVVAPNCSLFHPARLLRASCKKIIRLEDALFTVQVITASPSQNPLDVTIFNQLQYTPRGVGCGAGMSLTGFHPLWDKILSQNPQAVADQGCHLEGSSPIRGPLIRGKTVPGYQPQ
jgi:hypothetical protein